MYCMYVWSSHVARVRINRVRLPILLVVSRTGKINSSLSPFAPENLVSRDGFVRPVPRQPAHLLTQAESGSIIVLTPTSNTIEYSVVMKVYAATRVVDLKLEVTCMTLASSPES